MYRRKRREKKRDIEDLMLKTRITEQYGLRVPFINAGMAFIATAAPGAGGAQGWRDGNIGRCCDAPRCAARGDPRCQSSQPRVLRRRYYWPVRRDRAHRGVRHGEGPGCCILLG